MSIKHILFIVPFSLLSIAHGNTKIKSQADNLHAPSMNFIENRGQIIDMNNNHRPVVLFTSDGGGMKVYLRKTGVSYVFTRYEGPVSENSFGGDDDKNPEHFKKMLNVGSEKLESATQNAELKTIKFHRIDMDFVDCNPSPTLLKQNEVEGYTNYYNAHCPNGITNVKGYNKIIYQDIYPNIDIIYYGGKGSAASGGLKYDIVVRPGGDPNDIKIKYTGQDDIEVEGSKLKVKSLLGDIVEEMPRVYQNINGKIVEVKAVYILEGTTLNFKLSNFLTNYPLVIDPWASYYGGSSFDYGISIATDIAGNVLVTGIAASVNLPVLAGGYSQIYGGGWEDAFVVKFNSAGTRLWACYYGGNDWDQGKGIATDNSGNVLITGITGSANFPILAAGGYSQAFGGGIYDAFVVKFNSSGTRLWACYYGGNDPEYGCGIAVDNTNNVLITGYTKSGNFPVLAAGGYSQPFGGGWEAYVAKFNSSGVRVWASYYGGSATDQGLGITTDNAGNVFMTGNTSSTNFPTLAAGSYSQAFGGITDAFIVKFNSAGTCLWACYYGGSASDYGYALAVDNNGNLLLTGNTSSTNFPVLAAGGYSQIYGGGGDAFVSKFNSAGICLWSCYYGLSALDWGWSITTDGKNNIYLLTEAEDVPTPSLVDACTWQPVFNGGVTTLGILPEDQLIVKFNPSGQRICTSYMGGTGEDDLDQGGGIAIYGNSLYITGSTNGGYPVTSGAFQTTYAGNWDAFVASICTNICEGKVLGLDFTANNTNGTTCLPITFNPTIANACDTTGYKFQWTFTGGTPSTSTDVNPAVSYSTAGNYAVKLILTTPCKTDSVIKPNFITITPCSITALASNDTICFGSCASISASCSNGTAPFSFSWSTGQTTATIAPCPTSTSTYTVLVSDASGTTSIVTSTINVYPAMNILTNVTNINCSGGNDGSASVTIGGLGYLWNTGATGASISNLPIGSYSVIVTDGNGCTNTTSISITQPTQITNTITAVNITCNGNNNGTANIASSGGTANYSYLWNTNSTTQQINNLTAGIYSVTVTDAHGCTIDTSVLITQPTLLQATIKNNNPKICAGQNILLSAGASGGTPVYSFLWSNNLIGITTVVSPNATSVYSVFVTDANGCVTSDSVTVIVNALPVVAFGSDKQVGCGPLCITLFNQTPLAQQLTWTLGDGNTISGADTIYHCFLNPGSYSISLTLTDNNGCSNTDSLLNYITVYPQPIAAFIIYPSSLAPLNSLVQFIDKSIGADSLIWLFGDFSNSTSSLRNPIFSYNDTGEFQITLIAINEYGCKDTAYGNIEIIPESNIFVPNTFTPNNDGVNDLFYPVTDGIVATDYELLIFDRWGNLIFTTNDLNEGWNGKANGEKDPAQIDTYVWKLNCINLIGERKKFLGHVNIVR